MVYYIITNMPGRTREGARVSKLYKLKMQGKIPDGTPQEEEKKVEPKKEEEKVEE